jgi:WD40 repeat protein
MSEMSQKKKLPAPENKTIFERSTLSGHDKLVFLSVSAHFDSGSIAAAGNNIALFSLAGERSPYCLSLGTKTDIMNTIKFLEDGLHLAVPVSINKLAIVSIDGQRIEAELDVDGGIRDIDYKNGLLAIAQHSGNLLLWNYGSNSVTVVETERIPLETVAFISGWYVSGVIVGSWSGRLFFWSEESGLVQTKPMEVVRPSAVRDIDTFGPNIVVALGRNRIARWLLKQGENEIGFLREEDILVDCNVTTAKYASKNEVVFACTDGSLGMWNTTNSKLLFRLELNIHDKIVIETSITAMKNEILALEVDKEKRMAIVGTSGGQVLSVDINTKEVRPIWTPEN